MTVFGFEGLCDPNQGFVDDVDGFFVNKDYSAMNPVRVAFNLIGGKNWTGGYNYLLNLVRALATLRPGCVTPVMCFGTDVADSEAEPFYRIPGVEVLKDPAFNDSRKNSALLRALLLGKDALRQAVFARARIDVLFENAQFNGWATPQPVMAWIPDFQHRLMPQLFTRAGYWKRELGFQAQVMAGRTIMLSSEDSRRVCERCYPASNGRTHVVHFTVPMPPPVSRERARAVADRYELPSRYLFMPNQFWQHKNHGLVIEALAKLKGQGRSDIVVAASGRMLDPRLPGHFPALQARVTELGLAQQFRILGMVPFEDLAPLLVASDALLNPSLFEGWSTTVEEARAAGVPMLLSDLPVHREQAQAQARYFDPLSPASLADALRDTTLPSVVDTFLQNKASDKRMEEFVDAFLGVVKVAQNA
jgi:glycosyltransferase involved in cell wall biosynthesis